MKKGTEKNRYFKIYLRIIKYLLNTSVALPTVFAADSHTPQGQRLLAEPEVNRRKSPNF
jgi:hypothetical protein